MTSIKKYLKTSAIYHLIMLFILGVGVFLRYRLYYSNFPLQLDEIMLLKNLENKVVWDLIKPLDYYQVAPPIFLLISKFAINFAHPDIYQLSSIMHLQSVVYSMLSLLFFPLFITRFLESKLAKIFAYAFFSINFLVITYGGMLKPYESDIFFTMLIIYLFSLINLEKISSKLLFFISFFMGFTVWFSSTALLILFCCMAVKLYYSWNDKKKFFINVCLPIAINVLFYVVVYLLPVMQTTYGYMNDFWYLSSNNATHFDMKYILLMLLAFFSLLKSKIVIFYLLSCVLFIRHKKMLYVVVPLLLILLAHFMHSYPIEQRTVINTVPLLLLILVMPIENVKNLIVKAMFCLVTLYFLFLQVHVIFFSDVYYNFYWIYPGTYTNYIDYMQDISQYKKEDKDLNVVIVLNKRRELLTHIFEYYITKQGFDMNSKKFIVGLEDDSNEVIKMAWEDLAQKKKSLVILDRMLQTDFMSNPHVKVLKEFKTQYCPREDDLFIYAEYVD